MTKTVKSSPVATKPTAPAPSTTDKGTVHVGGGMIRFAGTEDFGTVHVGGGMIRF